ncbi:hypothetical protein N0V83_009044 [Neocucurbitaria cava]|uniref:BZIP domain-containing protein n=1 Tax=Neocucurbitaria cava TaxID=798079 RepID=A0A9W8Y383_9PLEO|nr:hypothetical protein N0V83_009044 [Neocucurbitaria cava]
MSSNVVETQSLGGFHYREALELQMSYSALEARFPPDDAHLAPNSSFSFNGQLQSIEPAPLMQFPPNNHHHDQQSPYRYRRDSPQTHLATTSPQPYHAPPGRRRKSEYAEPGSARAIYLAKNRQAASKCRGKQKRHQEELVELAREVERKNKDLRAEVEVLKCALRDLMNTVAQHNGCSDKRLTAYVQREADRLAAGVVRNDFPVPPPIHRHSFGGGGGGISPMDDGGPSPHWT